MDSRSGDFSYSDLRSRRNWKVCWRWSLSVLAIEFALVAVLIGFAIGAQPDPKVKSVKQAQQVQQTHPNAIRKACPGAAAQRMHDL